MTTVKKIARLAQELSSEEFTTLLELRKVLIGTAPRRQRRAKVAKAPRAVKAKAPAVKAATAKAPAVAPGNGEAVKRGPGRPRKVHMIPVEGVESQA